MCVCLRQKVYDREESDHEEDALDGEECQFFLDTSRLGGGGLLLQREAVICCEEKQRA